MTRRPLGVLLGLVLALATVTVGLLVTAPGAAANPFDCKEAPVPELPSRGIVSFFETRPDPLPPPGDPWAEDPTTTIYQQYGYAGLRWNTYDLGCGPDIARSPDAVVGNSTANWVMNTAKLGVSGTEALMATAFDPSVLSTFDPLVTRVVEALRNGIFEQWVFVVLAATGALLVLRARKASLASSAAAIGWALLVLVLVTAVFRWPLAAGQATDATVRATLGAVAQGFGGDDTPGEQLTGAGRSVSNLHEAVLYQNWLTGTFGSAHSDVAHEHGPAIFDAQALTWAETELLRTDPSAAQEVLAAKAQQWEETAALVKAADPDAYEYLTGKRSDTRVGAALLANLAALAAVPFMLLSSLLVMGALIIVRLGVMLFPAFATLGLFPAMRGLVIGIANTMAAAIINATVFGVGALVMVAGVNMLLDPRNGLPPWLAVLLVLLLTIVMWVILKPFRRLTRMVSPQHGFFADAASAVTSTAGKVTGLGKRVVAGAAGSFIGNAAAQAIRDDGRPENAQAATDAAGPVPTRAESGSLAPVALSSGPSPAYALPAAPTPATGGGGADGPGSGHGTGPPPPHRTLPYVAHPDGIWRPSALEDARPHEPLEAATVPDEQVDGEQVHVVYRPDRGHRVGSGV